MSVLQSDNKVIYESDSERLWAEEYLKRVRNELISLIDTLRESVQNGGAIGEGAIDTAHISNGAITRDKAAQSFINDITTADIVSELPLISLEHRGKTVILSGNGNESDTLYMGMMSVTNGSPAMKWVKIADANESEV